MATIGKRNTLTVLRASAPGIYLDGGEHGEILLPNRYVPQGVARGDRLNVFVYRDSEDRLVASTEAPRATVGEVATLKVISVNRQIGVFLDWGLPKDLLLPFREQTGPVQHPGMRPGRGHVIAREPPVEVGALRQGGQLRAGSLREPTAPQRALVGVVPRRVPSRVL